MERASGAATSHSLTEGECNLYTRRQTAFNSSSDQRSPTTLSLLVVLNSREDRADGRISLFADKKLVIDKPGLLLRTAGLQDDTPWVDNVSVPIAAEVICDTDEHSRSFSALSLGAQKMILHLRKMSKPSLTR